MVTTDRRETINQNKWFALSHMQEQNRVNKLYWKPSKIALAEHLKSEAQQAFMRSKVYMNYRKKYIAIKIDQPTSHDLVSKEAQDFLEVVRDHNIEMVTTDRKIMIRIR